MTAKIFPGAPVTPTGFGTCGSAEVIVGANALPRTHPARPAPAARATGRQRRDGRLPAGNSSTTSTHSPRPSSQVQPSQLPSVRVRGKWISSWLKPPTA